MEKLIGRYLEPHEVVDHRNGDKGDNRPQNLRLFSSNAEHLAATLKGRVPKWSEEGRVRLAAANRVLRLRRRMIRSIRDGGLLPQRSSHRCLADTCPLFETGQAARRARQRAVARAWRKRRKEQRLQTAA
ncbi:HNH endonuclease [Pseudarthrobacter sp. ATCC 49987]|uniref:HNH endonuclease n=1 Tax=Pseudarthrobacter sp. ATCC 49987 TaxID=2698204 RepID=UPI003FCE0356